MIEEAIIELYKSWRKEFDDLFISIIENRKDSLEHLITFNHPLSIKTREYLTEKANEDIKNCEFLMENLVRVQ